jgi:hypothetical protein
VVMVVATVEAEVVATVLSEGEGGGGDGGDRACRPQTHRACV